MDIIKRVNVLYQFSTCDDSQTRLCTLKGILKTNEQTVTLPIIWNNRDEKLTGVWWWSLWHKYVSNHWPVSRWVSLTKGTLLLVHMTSSICCVIQCRCTYATMCTYLSSLISVTLWVWEETTYSCWCLVHVYMCRHTHTHTNLFHISNSVPAQRNCIHLW